MSSCCVSAGLDLNSNSQPSSAPTVQNYGEINNALVWVSFWPPTACLLSPCSAQEVWLSFRSSQTLTTLFLFMSWSASGDIHKRRHGTGCTAPTCFHCSITFLGKTAGLETDKPVCRQNTVIIAFQYNKTVSLTYKTNTAYLRDIISHVMHVWLRFKASSLLAACDEGISDQRVTHDGSEECTAFMLSLNSHKTQLNARLLNSKLLLEPDDIQHEELPCGNSFKTWLKPGTRVHCGFNEIKWCDWFLFWFDKGPEHCLQSLNAGGLLRKRSRRKNPPMQAILSRFSS